MRKFLTFLIALTTVASVWASAFAQMTLTGAGSTRVGSSGASYTGPGDLSLTGGVTPVAWFGMRAFSAAKRGNAAINICDPSNVTCADWNTNAVTGALVATTNPLNGTDCTVSTTCTVQKIYDQLAGNACSSASCDIVQTTAANRPTFKWSCVNSLPCAVFAQASSQSFASGNTYAHAQPLSFSVVSEQTASPGNYVGLLGDASANNTGPLWSAAAGDVVIYGGSGIVNVAAANNSLHAMNFLLSGSSSNANIDGTNTSVSTGASSYNGTIHVFHGAAAFATGYFEEGGIWTGSFSSTDDASLCHNQFTYWGTVTSC
jgi:hypothetical protein